MDKKIYDTIRRELKRNNPDLLLRDVPSADDISIDEIAQKFQTHLINFGDTLSIVSDASLYISKSYTNGIITLSKYVSVIRSFFNDVTNAKSSDDIYDACIRHLILATYH